MDGIGLQLPVIEFRVVSGDREIKIAIPVKLCIFSGYFVSSIFSFVFTYFDFFVPISRQKSKLTNQVPINILA